LLIARRPRCPSARGSTCVPSSSKITKNALQRTFVMMIVALRIFILIYDLLQIASDHE
jgi:hypothetical protein